MKKNINVLSLFDGMSCGRVALERVGFTVNQYFASEVDKYAIKIAQKNYPDTIQIGDVTKVSYSDGVLRTENGDHNTTIDLVMGGSPCQGFSFAGKQLNFEDPRSRLFFEFERIVKEVNPAYFFLENVRMKKESLDVISERMGVEPVFVCSSNFSAQNRKRYYWTNIEGVEEKKPTKEGVLLKDVLEDIDGVTVVKNKGVYREISDKSTCVDANYHKGPDNHGQRTLFLSDKELERAKKKYSAQFWPSGNRMGAMKFPDKTERKAKTLCAVQITADRATNHIKDNYGIRKLTPVECERLQTLPDNYTEGVSNSQRYKMIGNGWTVDAIVYFFKNMKF